MASGLKACRAIRPSGGARRRTRSRAQRAVPEGRWRAPRLAAARHDCEAVQIVVRPRKPLKGLTAQARRLARTRRRGHPAENESRSCACHYHFVHHPTDETGVRDWWPDALPPLDQAARRGGRREPAAVGAGPRAHGRDAGRLHGQVTLRAEGFAAHGAAAAARLELRLAGAKPPGDGLRLQSGRDLPLSRREDRGGQAAGAWTCTSRASPSTASAPTIPRRWTRSA